MIEVPKVGGAWHLVVRGGKTRQRKNWYHNFSHVLG